MILIATDGVFSMDGTVAPLKYETILLVNLPSTFFRLLFLKSKLIDPSQKTYLFLTHTMNIQNVLQNYNIVCNYKVRFL